MTRSRSLFPLAVLVLIAVPIVEVWLLIQVGRQIGGWWTVAILVAEALLGAWLLRREGRRAWATLQEAFGTGRMPTRELTDAALVLVGGLLLMLPGFLTDVIGFVCLLPFTRPLARRLLEWLVVRRVSRLASPLLPAYDPRQGGRATPGAGFGHGFGAGPSSGDIIEGEIVEGPDEDHRGKDEDNRGGTGRSRLPQRR
jgi:UPF0716 protein FxsA